MIRPATIQDAQTIASIYNHYVKSSVVTFEVEPVSKFEMASRIKSITENYPFLVFEETEQVLGYAYITQWKARFAYRFSAEDTVYLHPDSVGKGIGSKLMEALIVELKNTDLHAIVGGIALPNEASVALHEKFGFRKIAQFEEIGFKFDRWVDVGYWELKL
jgi:L-amino acid N-acyltransferase YncA